METKEKQGFLEKIKKEIIDHKWLCIMCGAAVLLILTVLLIPVNNGKSVLYNVISSNKDEVKSEFSIVSINKKSEGKYINNNEEFIVTTRNGSLEEVKKHLFIEPALNYEIVEEGKDKYTVQLQDVPRDTLININYVTDEIAEHRWAFQSDKDLKVTSVYPTNEASGASVDTVIEVVLSMAVDSNFSKHFSIEPKVEGSFEQIGRVLRFKPNNKLNFDTKYTIHIEKGYEYNGLVMEEGYTSSFSTYKTSYDSEYSIKYNSITADNINTFKVGEQPILKLYPIKDSKQAIGKVTIARFKNSNHFMKYLKNEKDYSIEDLGEYKYTNNPLYKNCIVLEKGLEKGYYLENVYLSTGELYTSIPVQVHDLSAFAFTSDRDLLVWVGSNNKLLKDIDISYKNQNFKTNENGIGILKDYNTKDSKLDYIYVGDKDPLIIGINNNDHSNYPYSYLYTDRPLYKNTDTVNIWGFVPLTYFEDEFNKNELILKFDDKAIDYSIDSNGIVSSKIELDNYQDSSYCLELDYKKRNLDTRCFEVKNYQNQIYSYKISSEKNYVYAGNNFEFDIEIEHVSGMTVTNKAVIVSYNEQEYRSTTDASGIAHFSIKTTRDTDSKSNISSETIVIKNSDVLYNEYNSTYGFYKINRLVDVDYGYSTKISDKRVQAKIYALDGNSSEKTISRKENYSLDLKKFIKKNYEGKVSIKVEEYNSITTQTGTRYNEFTKENQPVYSYSHKTNIIKTENVEVKDGELDHVLDFEVKESDANNSYSYSYYITINDENGIPYEIHVWFDRDDLQTESDYYKGYINYHSAYYSEGDDYNVYRYYLDSQSENNIYSVNEKMDFVLKNYRKEVIKENAKVLEIKYKNKIIDTYLYDNTEDVTNKFTKKDEPGMDIAGAYYIDDKFYRLPNDYYDYKKEDSLVDISIKTNKKEYKPREEVEVEINTKDSNGKGIGTVLNISVVDESVFNLAEDNTNILDSLHINHYYYSYLYSTFRDYEMFLDGGGAGSTSGPDRYDFGDTIYFQNVATDSNGNAKIKFKLNDSITSFRITVHAANTDNKVGSNKKLISSKIPLSISYTEPRSVKTSDDLVLNANIIGISNENVEVTFELEGKDKKVVNTTPGKTVFANFGKVDVGTYNVRISAKNGTDSDAVKFQIPVILTQEEIAIKTTKMISENKELKVKRNPITIELYRDGMSKYIYYLDKMNNYERRLDTLLSARQSAIYENKYYGYNNSLIDTKLGEFQSGNYLRYLPNEEVSIVLTALTNYYTPGLFEIKKDNIYSNLTNNNIITNYNKVIEYYLLLASMKEPVLDDLQELAKYESSDDEHKAYLILAFAFIGDYDTAKELYKQKKLDIDEGLKGLLATFIEKEKATDYIDLVLRMDEANRYVYFAMMSYLINNNAKLSEKEEVTVKYGDHQEKVVLEGLKVAKLDINEKDLKSLNFSSDYKDILINYYYQGELDRESEKVQESIKMTLNKKSYKFGEYANLKLDVSKLSEVSGYIKVYLPNGLRLSGNVSGAHVTSNRTDYIIIYISKDRKNNIVDIPLYIASIGDYKIDSAILKINDNYFISNELEVSIE